MFGDNFMEYKINLKKAREQNNLNQSNIANMLGIDRTVYNKYENGYELIPIKHLISFCNYFNIRVDEIFNFNIQEQLPINKEFDIKIVGKRLKEWRKKNKITQDKLAKMLNTNKSVICNYEKGRYLIATPFLYQICHQYGVSADYLLGRIDKPQD